MRRHAIFSLLVVVPVVAACLAPLRAAVAEELTLRKGDHVCLIGNALGERLQHHNYWETLLHRRHAELELTVRNLCFPGDEPYERLRSLNFGDPDSHLRHSQASVILCFFGFNESFRGEHGLDKFRDDLVKLCRHMQSSDYGRGEPRVVLVSPIAFENTGHDDLPEGSAENRRLAMYAAAMKQAAAEAGAGFANLFDPTRALFDSSDRPLTLDGAHLGDEGYRQLAPLLMQALFGPGGAPSAGNDQRLRAEVADKNFHWWHRHRAVNGYSIWGTRGLAGSDGTYVNRDVMERERAILDQMCANRDRRIWTLARGGEVPAEVDDSNTLPFIQPKTNVGGPDDPNRQRGKLGSLDYLSAAEQQQRFKLAPGYQINLFASEEEFPELANPVALNFDARGRMWVSTMPSYPQWQPKTELDDKLLILEDDDGDGRADNCKVFADGLHQPTGFELGHGGAYVAQQPDVLFLQDTDGDDRSDVRIRRLVGFGTADSHHGLAAFEWGPEGALYFQEGTFKQSQIESPYGLTRLGDAGVWRFEPRTSRFEVHVSLAFANPWGHVFDRWGQNFIADASPGFNYWAAPISGQVRHPDKHPGGSRDSHLDFGGSKASMHYPTFIKKRTRPSCGCEIVSSRHFPPEAQGDFLLNNVIGDRAVLQHKVRDQGSGFAGEESQTLVSGEDGNFRPVDLQFGPDGALYIVDWHNALIGHLQHNLREPHRDHSHGRIWRVTCEGRDLVSPPKIAGQPVSALLDLLKQPEDRTRYRVRRELAARPTEDVVEPLEQWLGELDPTDKDHLLHRLEGLWVCQSHNLLNLGLLAQLLEAPDFRARAAAVRAMSHWRHQISEPLRLLRPRIDDPHPRVRLEALRALSFHPRREAMELALNVLQHPRDVYLEYTLNETVRVLEELIHQREMRGVRGGGDAEQEAPAGHAHHHATGPAPILFLDKPPKLVAYQVARLDNAQLTRVEIGPGEKKFLPVLEALVRRPGVTRQDRQAAAAKLAELNGTSEIGELLLALDGADDEAARQITSILLRQPGRLSLHADTLQLIAHGRHPAARSAAYAVLATSAGVDAAWQHALQSTSGREDLLRAVSWIDSKRVRSALRPHVVDSLDPARPPSVRRAAVEALGHVPESLGENFQLAAGLVGDGRLRPAVVRTLTRIPRKHRAAAPSRRVLKSLIGLAARTPPAKRTTPSFLDAMQLADQLLASVPSDESPVYRRQLRELVVRVVQIETVHEEMRYDVPYFACEAGRPVQLVLRNDDLMAHNLVVCQAGKLREVAMAAAAMTPAVDARGRQYVPQLPEVLQATKLVPPHGQDVLTFTAPKAPGEYPYVCTFPNHWMRMNGVMVVVEDMDAWLADPKPPADPLGSTRSLVQNWTIEDLEDRLPAALEGRTAEIGRKIFAEASCIHCHQLHGQGAPVGPPLKDVARRWKGDRRAVLLEVLDPSHRVEPKYAVYNVQTEEGEVLTGLMTGEDADSVTLVTNPERPEPRTIRREDIARMKKTSTSLMPKGLLDRFTEDEIFELLAYVLSENSE